jgi:fatty-acyl-CoA synthase
VISGIADVEKIEACGWPGDLPHSTYEMIRRGAALDPSAPALSFFLSAATHKTARTWTYQDLLDEITRSANGFHALGADRDTVIAVARLTTRRSGWRLGRDRSCSSPGSTGSTGTTDVTR